MDKNRREYLTNRLMSGKTFISLGDKQYYLVVPSTEIIYRANEVYYSVMNKNRFNDWLSKNDISRVLAVNDIWNAENEKNLEAIDKRIEDLKVEMYQSLMRSEDEKNKIRKTLRMVQEKQAEMLLRKHMYDYMTIEGFAETAKNRFLISSCLYESDGRPFNGDVFELQQIMTELDRIKISVEEFRELARSDPWRSYWSCSKEANFKVIGEEQRTLILFSKMYDNAYEHPECPSDVVINDDDMFDGWLIEQRRIREKEKTTKTLNKAAGFEKKHPKANEIFIPAKSRQHANEIYDYNDMEAKLIQRQRAAAIVANGSVDEKDLPDVRQNLQIQAMNLQKEKLKGK